MFLSVCYNHWTYYYWYPHAYVLSIHLQCVQRKHRSKLKRTPPPPPPPPHPPHFREIAFCILTNSSNPAPGSFRHFSLKTVPFRQSNVMPVACAQLTNKMSNLQTKENRFLFFSSVLSVCLHGKVCKMYVALRWRAFEYGLILWKCCTFNSAHRKILLACIPKFSNSKNTMEWSIQRSS